MNNRPIATAAVVLLLLVAAVAALFIVQNHSRTAQLSLDLGIAAWQLKEPLSIPILMAICFGSGLVVAGVPLGIRSASANRRARRLEQEVALSGGSSGDGWR